MVKEMFQRANIEGNFTNHSLRATCATQLFDAGVPEASRQKTKLDTSQFKKLFDFMKGLYRTSKSL